jgi:hypothetical protein
MNKLSKDLRGAHSRCCAKTLDERAKMSSFAQNLAFSPLHRACAFTHRDCARPHIEYTCPHRGYTCMHIGCAAMQ